jgi:STIP1 family protein 1
MNFFKVKTLVADSNNVVRGSAAEVAAYIDRDIAAIKRDIKNLDKCTGILGKTLYKRLYDALEKDQRLDIKSLDKKNPDKLVAVLERHAEEWDQFRAICRNNHSSGVVQQHLQQQRNSIEVDDAPDSLLDPISLHLFLDPVVTPSGITYERNNLLHHFKHNGPYDPLTRKRVLEDQLYPNLVIRDAVAEYIDKSMS